MNKDVAASVLVLAATGAGAYLIDVYDCVREFGVNPSAVALEVEVQVNGVAPGAAASGNSIEWQTSPVPLASRAYADFTDLNVTPIAVPNTANKKSVFKIPRAPASGRYLYIWLKSAGLAVSSQLTITVIPTITD